MSLTVLVWASVHRACEEQSGNHTRRWSASSDATVAPAGKDSPQLTPDIVWLGHEASVGETNNEQPTSHEAGISTKITFPICSRSMPLCPVKLHVDPLFTK
jgi:hypothetical protein